MCKDNVELEKLNVCVVETHCVHFPSEKLWDCDTRNEIHIVAGCGLGSVEGTFCPESRKCGWGWHSCLLIWGS